MNNPHASHIDLQELARQSMLEHGFEPEYPAEALEQVAELKAHPPQISTGGDVRDLRDLLWSSIDNDTSRDLDQIEVAERLSNGGIRILIGIADVDAMVVKGTPIDLHAQSETTTVYTGIVNFSMLPEELSTGLTSLNENADRLGVVVEMVLASDASIQSSDACPALARNNAQLTYNGVCPGLEAKAPPPSKVARPTPFQHPPKL